MFTSLELGKDEKELAQGGLSLRKNPLLVTILDGCETLKALTTKNQITPDLVAGAKGLVLMRTDKVGGLGGLRAARIGRFYVFLFDRARLRAVVARRPEGALAPISRPRTRPPKHTHTHTHTRQH